MRFYNPTPREYQSVLVDTRLPYEFLAANVKQKEKEADDTLAFIKALPKNIEGLPVDQQEMLLAQQDLDETLKPIQTLNPTKVGDFETQKLITETTKNYKAKLKKYEDVYGVRLKQAEEELENIRKLKDGTKKRYLQQELQNKYWTPKASDNSANYNKKTGTYNKIGTPDDFEWKEYDKDMWEIGTKLETDLNDLGYSFGNIDNFNKMLLEGSIETRTADRILNSLIGYTKNPDVIKTATVTRYMAGENYNDALKNEANAIVYIKNKKGEIVPQINSNSLLGQSINSVIAGRETKKIKKDRSIYNDKQAEMDYGQYLINYSEQGDITPGATVDNSNLVKKADGTIDVNESILKDADKKGQGFIAWLVNNSVASGSRFGDFLEITGLLDKETRKKASTYANAPITDDNITVEDAKKFAKKMVDFNLKITGSIKNSNGTLKNLNQILLENENISKTVDWRGVPAVGKDWDNTQKAWIEQGGVEFRGITEEGKSIDLDNILGDKSKDIKMREIDYSGNNPKVIMSYTDDGKPTTVKSNIIHDQFVQKSKPLLEITHDFADFVKPESSASYKEKQKTNFDIYGSLVGAKKPEEIISAVTAPSTGNLVIFYNIPTNEGGHEQVSSEFKYLGNDKKGKPLYEPILYNSTGYGSQYSTMKDFVRNETDYNIKSTYNTIGLQPKIKKIR